MNLIIAGGRDFTEWVLLCETLATYTAEHGVPDKVICGMAKGADLLGKQWADMMSIPVDEYPADWTGEGKRAGLERNVAMAQNATHLIAFHDRKSTGTAHMIKTAKSFALRDATVVYYNQVKPTKTLF